MVGFGVHLARHRVVEWNAHYLRYDQLKSQVDKIKEATQIQAFIQLQKKRIKESQIKQRRLKGKQTLTTNTTINQHPDHNEDEAEEDDEELVDDEIRLASSNLVGGGDQLQQQQPERSGSSSPNHSTDDDAHHHQVELNALEMNDHRMVDRFRADLSENIELNMMIYKNSADGGNCSEECTEETKENHTDRIALTSSPFQTTTIVSSTTADMTDTSASINHFQSLQSSFLQLLNDGLEVDTSSSISLTHHRLEREFFSMILVDIEKVDLWFHKQVRFFEQQFQSLKQQFQLLKQREREKKRKQTDAQKTNRREIHLEPEIDPQPADVSPPHPSTSPPHSAPDPPSHLATSTASPSLPRPLIAHPWRSLRNNFIELYRGAQLLKEFKLLNYTGFIKILKKHDKESKNVQLHPWLSKELDRLLCFASEQPTRVMLEMEQFFIQNFTRGNRKLGLTTLRPQTVELSHLVTFRLGLTLGLSIALCVVLFFLVHFVSINQSETIVSQLSPVLPIYRGLFLFLLHLWLWGGNVYLFHLKRINYIFIFDMNSRTQLQYAHILQAASLLTCLWLLSLDLYISTTLLMVYWPNLQPGWFHFVLYASLISMCLCPFNYFARPTRIYIAHTLWNILTTGWGPVRFRDFYTANQLCSLVNVLNDLSYGACYYASGDFLIHSEARCKVFQSNAIWVIAFLPYYFRCIQCLKRYKDSGAKRQLYNAGKYGMSLFTTFWSVMHKHYPDNPTILTGWILSAICSTTVSFIWDVKCDWNLLEFQPVSKSKEATSMPPSVSGRVNPSSSGGWSLRSFWFTVRSIHLPSTNAVLRRHRLLDWSGFYFIAIITDAAMRLAWVATISPDVLTGGLIPTDYFKTIIYSIEVIRRNQWNFYRLENEHLCNVEKEKVLNIDPVMDTTTTQLSITATTTTDSEPIHRSSSSQLLQPMAEAAANEKTKYEYRPPIASTVVYTNSSPPSSSSSHLETSQSTATPYVVHHHSSFRLPSLLIRLSELVLHSSSTFVHHCRRIARDEDEDIEVDTQYL